MHVFGQIFKHVGIACGLTELCGVLWNPGPSKPQIINNDKFSGKKNARKHKFVGPDGLGTTPGFVPGTNPDCPWDKPLGRKSCRTKVPRIFRIFVPNSAPNFAVNFPRIF